MSYAAVIFAVSIHFKKLNAVLQLCSSTARCASSRVIHDVFFMCRRQSLILQYYPFSIQLFGERGTANMTGRRHKQHSITDLFSTRQLTDLSSLISPRDINKKQQVMQPQTSLLKTAMSFRQSNPVIATLISHCFMVH